MNQRIEQDQFIGSAVNKFHIASLEAVLVGLFEFLTLM